MGVNQQGNMTSPFLFFAIGCLSPSAQATCYGSLQARGLPGLCAGCQLLQAAGADLAVFSDSMHGQLCRFGGPFWNDAGGTPLQFATRGQLH